jgi:hypothetical protein
MFIQTIDFAVRLCDRILVTAEGNFLAAVAGLLVGAGMTLLYVRLRPGSLGLAGRQSATERLEALREEMMVELKELEKQMRRPAAPIRMDAALDDSEYRDAA